MGRAGALALMLFLLACCARGAQGADRIYWANSSDRFASANLDGTGVGELPIGMAVTGASGIAIDVAAGRLYWTNNNDHNIFYVALDGSGGGGPLNTAGATFARPGGLAIDRAANRIYWTNYDANKISYANLDGSGGHDLPTTGAPIDLPALLALDPAGNRVYWTNQQGPGISYAKLSGGGGGSIPTTGATVSYPNGLAIDPVGRRVYWAGDGAISFARLNGSGGEDLPIIGATVNTPAGLAIDPDARRIFWSSYSGNTISSANLDGSGAVDLPIPTADASGPTSLVLMKVPAPDDEPVVTGGANPGSMLSCSPATWAPDLLVSQLYRAPQSVSYLWSRDGVPIPGATTSSYAAADGGQYRCGAIASNAAGSSAQVSAPHTVLSAPDFTAPRIVALDIKPQAFPAAPRGPSIAKATGAAVNYTLSEAAATKFTVARSTIGAKRGKHCVAAPHPAPGKRCTRYVALAGSFSRSSGAGATKFRFTGRLKGHSLAPGGYRLTAQAQDAAGNDSAPARRSFRIRR